MEKVPLRLGVRCHPPALTLFYQESKKNRVRIMPVRFLNKKGSVEGIVQQVKFHHAAFLNQVSSITFFDSSKISHFSLSQKEK